MLTSLPFTQAAFGQTHSSDPVPSSQPVEAPAEKQVKSSEFPPCGTGSQSTLQERIADCKGSPRKVLGRPLIVVSRSIGSDGRVHETYLDSHDGGTDLLWGPEAPGKMDLETAQKYCASLTDLNQKWRLPTLKDFTSAWNPSDTTDQDNPELYPDAIGNSKNPAYNSSAVQLFTVISPDGGPKWNDGDSYWTDTPAVSTRATYRRPGYPGHNWYFDTDGKMNHWQGHHSYHNKVRCVADAKVSKTN